MVGRTNDERGSIHNPDVEKHCRGSERIVKMFSNKLAHLNCEYLHVFKQCKYVVFCSFHGISLY